MKTETTANKSYFSELALRLRQTGFVVLPEQDGFLPVEWNDQPLCRVASTGGIRYRQEDMTDSDTELACDRAADIAATVREYMTLLDKAPLLKADSLHEPYQVLAEFNDVVLAALPGKHGVQFTTWAWINERTSLWQGHYAGNDYQAAKRDFAIRSACWTSTSFFLRSSLRRSTAASTKRWRIIIPSPRNAKSCWRAWRRRSNVRFLPWQSWSASQISRNWRQQKIRNIRA